MGKLTSEVQFTVSQLDRHLFEQFRNSTVVLVGMTGFIGQWFYSFLAHANNKYGLEIEFLISTRHVANSQKLLDADNSSVKFLEIDFSNMNDLTPETLVSKHKKKFVFLGASTASYRTSMARIDYKELTNLNASKYFHTIFDFSDKYTTVINLSSGGVYDRGSSFKISESSKLVSPDQDTDSYIIDKLETEIYLNKVCFNLINLRLFSLYGPLFPINGNYLISQLINSAVNGTEMVIQGNVESLRSYIYPTDLVSAILHCVGESGNINIGGNQPLTIFDMIKCVEEEFGSLKITFDNYNAPVRHYFGDTFLLESLSVFRQKVSFQEGLSLWNGWLKET
jgi:nucleoside-diphosphate-sugar epimerase